MLRFSKESACGVIFFCSGTSALLFEILWFRQASVAFGNSVWATSLVLSSFMGGLALGNAVAARWGTLVRRPLRTYALLEVTVGVAGFGLVLLLPALTGLLAPLFGAFAARPFLLNAARLAIAFLLLLAPTTAMGATLPLLAKTVSSWDLVFGRVLGRLYGWNTLGAVIGCVAAEAWFLRWFGIRETGLLALGLNFTAASLAIRLTRQTAGGSAAVEAVATAAASLPGPLRLLPRERPLLFASFLSGMLLLALEVVWFRFLLLFVIGTSLAFAVMLAVVLLGIACGGFVVSAWSRRFPEAHAGPTVALLSAGAFVVLGYAGLSGRVARTGGAYLESPGGVAALAFVLMLPVALASGVAFTLTGTALYRVSTSETRATGLLTLLNTLGGMAGSLAAGFVLLPSLGVERSLWLLVLGYGGAALSTCWADWRLSGRIGRAAAVLAGVTFVLATVLFPSGLMSNFYIPLVLDRFGLGRDGRVAAWREGVTETISYLQYDLLGEPLSYRLVTNGHSMSASTFKSNRYMKLFVYLPVALRSEPKNALLISYGVGSTAKALTDTASIDHLDIVDISRDILELSRVVYPDAKENPTRDPRATIHVEDGRFFLQTTRERYDLITGEPPPPQNSGVVNLYTREYFSLIRERLAERGAVSYWLPVHALRKPDALAIVRGFCDVFPDCSLWNGSQADWILLGFRGSMPPGDEAAYSRQWREPRVAAELGVLGFERPEQVASTFLGDSAFLGRLTRGVAPLVDDFPKRLSAEQPGSADAEFFLSLRKTSETAIRFARSPLSKHAFPGAVSEKALAAFFDQQILDNALNGYDRKSESFFPDLDLMLARTSLRVPVLWMLGTEAGAVPIAQRAAVRGEKGPLVEGILAADAVSRRAYREAEGRYASIRPRSGFIDGLRVVLLCLDGDRSSAEKLASELRGLGAPDARFWAWCESRYGLRRVPSS